MDENWISKSNLEKHKDEGEKDDNVTKKSKSNSTSTSKQNPNQLKLDQLWKTKGDENKNENESKDNDSFDDGDDDLEALISCSQSYDIDDDGIEDDVETLLSCSQGDSDGESTKKVQHQNVHNEGQNFSLNSKQIPTVNKLPQPQIKSQSQNPSPQKVDSKTKIAAFRFQKNSQE